ncbi:MAG: type II toxin-antitoxin system HicA family toxin [Candidatus Zambryskibacteria bacterium]|nr:type II toxin-antitoxin system HicA family toxin [Candidatus Zambryskibacteria bacterium]
MSKLRVLSGKDIVKFLRKEGFEIEYGKGSHSKLFKLIGGKKESITIPLHKEIAEGTLRAIYNQASKFISEEKLRKYFYTN